MTLDFVFVDFEVRIWFLLNTYLPTLFPFEMFNSNILSSKLDVSVSLKMESEM